MARDASIIIQLFRDFDRDASGCISEEELTSVLARLDSSRWTAEAVKDLFTLADLNRDGVIDYTEFVAWLTEGEHGSNIFRIDNVRMTHAAVRATRLDGKQVASVLQHYDPKKSLDKLAFVKMWRDLELSTEEAAGGWFDAIDVNSNGLVSFKELMTALVLCSGEEDIHLLADMLMKVHSHDGVGLNRKDFEQAMRKSVDLMKATFYPALKEQLLASTTPEGITWADVFVRNMRSDMGAAAPESDVEVLELALRSTVYPEEIFDTMLEGISEEFKMMDSDLDATLTVDELSCGLSNSPDLQKILFPHRTVGAMVGSYMSCMNSAVC